MRESVHRWPHVAPKVNILEGPLKGQRHSLRTLEHVHMHFTVWLPTAHVQGVITSVAPFPLSQKRRGMAISISSL